MEYLRTYICYRLGSGLGVGLHRLAGKCIEGVTISRECKMSCDSRSFNFSDNIL